MTPARWLALVTVLAIVAPVVAQLIRTDAEPGDEPRARRTP